MVERRIRRAWTWGVLSALWLAGCQTSEEPNAPEEPVVAVVPEGPIAPPISPKAVVATPPETSAKPSQTKNAVRCSIRPEQIGLSGFRVTSCTEFPKLPSIYALTLVNNEQHHEGRVVVLDSSGAIVREQGLEAFERWIGGDHCTKHCKLDLKSVTIILEAFDAFPKGFDRNAISFDNPSIGRSQFTLEPWRLELVTQVATVSGGGMGYTPPRHSRAVLRRQKNDSPLRWETSPAD